MCRAEYFIIVCWDHVQGLAQRHTELMHDLEQRMDSERAALRQEAAAMAASAAAAGEEHGRAVALSRQAAADCTGLLANSAKPKTVKRALYSN